MLLEYFKFLDHKLRDVMLPHGLLKEFSKVFSILVRGLDIIAVMVAGLAAYYYRFSHFDITEQYMSALCIGAILTTVVFSFFHIYESVRGQAIWQYISRLLQAILVVLLLLAGLAFLTKTGVSFSRTWFLLWSIFSVILLVLFRGSLLFVLRLMRAHGMNERRVIIIGAGKLSAKLAETVHQALWTGFRVEKIFEVQSRPEDLGLYLEQSKLAIDEIWLALPLGAEDCVKDLLYQLRHHTIAIRFVLDVFGLDLHNHSFTDLAGFPAVNLSASPMIGMNKIIKALEDKLLASLIILIVSPLLLIIAIAVKLTSKGPVLFKQKRHGWDGRVINVYKFRTMYEHEDKPGVVTQASENDARITPLGRFLRKTSLDELPQFYNVLQGKMSIVGPRPHAVEHNEFYKDSIKAYMQRHKVKPGITGWAQVNGWRGKTEIITKMEKRVEYDLYYIENWSLFLDLKIIFLTIIHGFVNKNAY